MTAHYSISDSRHLPMAQRLELFGMHLQVLLEEFNQLSEDLAAHEKPDQDDNASS